MNMYDFFMPNVNFFGRGAVKVTGERCQILGGKKALIVTDSFLRSLPGGPVEKVTESLDAVGIDYAFYDGVEPNPKDTNVRDGLAIFESEQCDLIVTVGGGSAHDCGKGIGIAATHDGDLYEDYAGIETLTNPLPPLVCVNTTAGTASEVTRHCVITNTGEVRHRQLEKYTTRFDQRPRTHGRKTSRLNSGDWYGRVNTCGRIIRFARREPSDRFNGDPSDQAHLYELTSSGRIRPKHRSA